MSSPSKYAIFLNNSLVVLAWPVMINFSLNAVTIQLSCKIITPAEKQTTLLANA